LLLSNDSLAICGIVLLVVVTDDASRTQRRH